MSYCKSWINYISNLDFVYKFKLRNAYQLPRIKKMTIFIDFCSNTNSLNNITSGLMILKMITGQKPNICRSKISAPGSKLRKGTIIGCKAFIKKNNLYNFLDIVVFYLLPQERNLKISKLDMNGNCIITLNNFYTFFKFFDKNLRFSNDLKVTLIINFAFVDINSLKLFFNCLGISDK